VISYPCLLDALIGVPRDLREGSPLLLASGAVSEAVKDQLISFALSGDISPMVAPKNSCRVSGGVPTKVPAFTTAENESMQGGV
jgi:hypothetical protein